MVAAAVMFHAEASPKRMATDDERRRSARDPLPACPECKADDHVAVTVRTDYALYFRCSWCGKMWSAQFPGKR
jgi:hypothetical protein